MKPEMLKGNLRMLLLSVLTDAPGHGYAMIERLRCLSGGEIDLPEGTIYPALHGLERDGLVSSRWSDDSGRRRRVYAVNRRGLASLRVQRIEWQTFTRAVSAVIKEGAWAT